MLHWIHLSKYKIGCARKEKNAYRLWNTPPRKSLADVAILNPEHLFEQAALLIVRSQGRPRQVDIRRAISAAYYGIFHAIITAAADEFVGGINRTRRRYGLVYRSVGHAWLRDLCKEVQKQTLPQKFKAYEAGSRSEEHTSE